MTPQSIRIKFPEVYQTEDVGIDEDLRGLKADPITNLKMGCFSIPSEFKRTDLFLVVQIFKVLTGEPEKVVSPYIRTLPDTKADENCKRLCMYRQQVGIGGLKLFENSKLGGAELKCSIFATKSCMSDAGIGQVRSQTLYFYGFLLAG
jgi:hypothetical protein